PRVLAREDGRRFFWDVALHPQRPVLPPQSREFLPLLGRQRAWPPATGVGLRLPHPASQLRLREIEFPRHRRDRLPTLSDDANSLLLKRRRERPPLPFGHDTLLPHFRAI